MGYFLFARRFLARRICARTILASHTAARIARVGRTAICIAFAAAPNGYFFDISGQIARMFDFANVWNEIVFGIIFFASGGVFLLFFGCGNILRRLKNAMCRRRGKFLRRRKK